MSKLRILTATVLAAFAAACGGDGGTPPPPTPASISVVQGDQQTGTVGRPAPVEVVVEVRDASGSPLAGVPVAFTVTGGGGSVSPASAVTDGTGRATTVWTFGTTAGNQTLRAQAENVSTVLSATAEADIPVGLEKIGGDNQTGGPGSTLPEPLAVRVTDEFGNPVVDFQVLFMATAGSLSPQNGITGADGTTSTRLTLPDTEQEVNVSAEGNGVPTRSFTATAAKAPLQVESDLERGRLTLGYDGSVRASGGSGSGFTFSVVSGELPPGLTLATDGEITGTPTEAGPFPFTARVVDDEGAQASRELTLTVCEAPLSLAAGESVVLDPAPPSECGFFLPSGADGDRYRVGVMRLSRDANPADVTTVRLDMTGQEISAQAAARAVETIRPPTSLMRVGDDALERVRTMGEATRAYHMELRRQEEEMFRRMGTEGVLPDRREGAGEALRTFSASATLPAKLRIDPTTPSSCSPAGTKVTALKLAEDDRLAIYQDSTQNADPDLEVTAAEAQVLLDFYRDSGEEVVDAYFDGVPDINGDGKTVVFISPVVGGGVAAFVWSGDFVAKSNCPASNEMEIVFFNEVIVRGLTDASSPEQGLETLVHEMKHVSSLFERLQRSNQMSSNQFHPLWIEEGVAEIAGEVSTRLAWSRQGGPAVNAQIVGQDFRDAGTVDNVVLGPVIRLFRAQGYLASQPNGVVTTPFGARGDHSIYGSGWTFHRWLGDAYGMAASAPLADSSMWRRLNGRDWPSGIQGLEQLTALEWEELLPQYAAAVMLNGTGAPQPARPYTTYDLVDAIELFCFAADDPCAGQQPGPLGTFPWPVTVQSDGTMTVPFGDQVIQGSIGPAGVRVHDFLSNGTGDGAEVNIEATDPATVVVVRVN